MLGLAGCKSSPKVTRYIFDKGTVGIVRVVYNRNDAPPLPVEKGFAVARIPGSLILNTSSHMNPTWDGCEFYFQAPDGSLEKLTAQDSKERRLWGFDKTSNPQEGDTESFFVGTEQQFSRGSKGGKEMGDMGEKTGRDTYDPADALKVGTESPESKPAPPKIDTQ